MMLHHPVICFRYEWLQDASSNVRVIKRSKRVSDVVEQCADDVLVVTTIFLGACRGLQRVFQTVDGETTVVVAQMFEVFKNAISN